MVLVRLIKVRPRLLSALILVVLSACKPALAILPEFLKGRSTMPLFMIPVQQPYAHPSPSIHWSWIYILIHVDIVLKSASFNSSFL